MVLQVNHMSLSEPQFGFSDGEDNLIIMKGGFINDTKSNQLSKTS